MARPVNADAKRREIVAEAAVLFDRDGYHAVGVGQIAEAVGIRKPTLYHYVSSKDELLTRIHEEFIDLLLERQAARPDGGPAADELRAVMSDVLELMETHRGHVRVFFEHHRELPDEARHEIRRKRDLYQAGVERAIARGVASGELRFIVIGGARGGPFGGTSTSEVSSWVTSSRVVGVSPEPESLCWALIAEVAERASPELPSCVASCRPRTSIP